MFILFLFKNLASAFPDYQLVLAGAPAIAPEYYKKYVGESKVKIIFDQTYRLLQHADVALVTSGTATLETALFRVPQVVCYHTPIGKVVSFLRRHILTVKLTIASVYTDTNGRLFGQRRCRAFQCESASVDCFC